MSATGDAGETGDGWGFDTRAVQAGRESGPLPDPAGEHLDGLGRPVSPGIQTASAYAFDRLDDLDRAFDDPRAGYVYARPAGPTGDAFAAAVAALEGAPGAVAFASGMAAIQAVLLAAGARPGEAVVAAGDLYGATLTLLCAHFAAGGVRLRLVDVTDLDAVRAALAETRPRVLYVETVSNPLLRLADVPALAALARDAGATLIVDNTFASPALCRPLAGGAHAVVHSATKYLGGHGDLVAGVVAAEASLLEPLRTQARIGGATLGAFDAWLALRGLRTLALRMERHCGNAAAVAIHLSGVRRVGRVYYPGLTSHPQHALAARLFGGRGFGGMVSFTIRDAGPAEVARFMDALRLFVPAPTMGDVYSLALYPARASHRGLSPEERHALGIGDDLVRLSVGIEGLPDLLADLDQALAR
jgi:cystathionine beta-lyase/cystathionine gamma-synthase